MNKDQKDTLEHMLGLNYGKKPYRNHYACGEGDLPHLRQMESEGLVRQYREPTKELPYHMFTVTDKGKELVGVSK